MYCILKNDSQPFFIVQLITVTCLVDAVNVALQSLNTNKSSSDWVIVLTDGEDNGSSIKINDLTAIIAASHANIIIIGVGADVPVAVLEGLAKSSPNGLYISASGDSQGINDAFDKVIAVIQGQVVLEVDIQV